MKFNPNDQVILGYTLQFLVNPYSFNRPLNHSVLRVASATEMLFTTNADVDLSDYFSRERNRSVVYGQKSQIDDNAFHGRVLHGVEDRAEILALVDDACNEGLRDAESRKAKKLTRINEQIAALEKEKAQLEQDGIKTVCGQYYAETFIKENKQAFLAQLDPIDTPPSE